MVRGQHLETIIPGAFRRVPNVPYTSERIQTPDDDFLDLDWYVKSDHKAVIISHGLEGSSQREYMRGMAMKMISKGYTAICWNYRGCGTEINRQLRMYHSGATDDLDTVVRHVLSRGYQQIALIGFSLGGNLTLKYVGEKSKDLDQGIRCCLAFSTPLDLAAASKRISEWDNWIYEIRFLKMLKSKIRQKHDQYPDKVDLDALRSCTTVWQFDNIFTGPLHGFLNARDYYRQCSSIHFLASITIPSLIVNAKNDPFLPKECYPYQLLEHHPYIDFESPDHGGHVGFLTIGNNGFYWSEDRAAEFISRHISTDL